MKAVIQVNVADDDGMQVIVDYRYTGKQKSYTIPAGEAQGSILLKILSEVRKQVRLEDIGVDN